MTHPTPALMVHLDDQVYAAERDLMSAVDAHERARDRLDAAVLRTLFGGVVAIPVLLLPTVMAGAAGVVLAVVAGFVLAGIMGSFIAVVRATSASTAALRCAVGTADHTNAQLRRARQGA